VIWLLVLAAVVVLGVVVAVIRHRNYLAELAAQDPPIYVLEHQIWPAASDEWYGHTGCSRCRQRLLMRPPTTAELNVGHTRSLSNGGPDPQTGVWSAPDYTIADEWVQLERVPCGPIRWMPVLVEAAALGQVEPVYVPGGCEVVAETPSPQYQRPKMYLGPPPGPRC
jgi:hypothetical protein